MARIAGVDLPRNKRIDIALTYIYGIGRWSSNQILSKAGVNGALKSDQLTDDQVKRIRDVIKKNTRSKVPFVPKCR